MGIRTNCTLDFGFRDTLYFIFFWSRDTLDFICLCLRTTWIFYLWVWGQIGFYILGSRDKFDLIFLGLGKIGFIFWGLGTNLMFAFWGLGTHVLANKKTCRV